MTELNKVFEFDDCVKLDQDMNIMADGKCLFEGSNGNFIVAPNHSINAYVYTNGIYKGTPSTFRTSGVFPSGSTLQLSETGFVKSTKFMPHGNKIIDCSYQNEQNPQYIKKTYSLNGSYELGKETRCNDNYSVKLPSELHS